MSDLKKPKNKIGLIIQGPLISCGRTGETIEIPLNKLTHADIVSYNCLDNIRYIYDKYSRKIDIVCVVWDTEQAGLLNSLSTLIPVDQIVLAHDNTPQLKAKSSLVPANNKYRQFLSSAIGAKKLLEQGCDYLIKMRSDQCFNLDILIENIETISLERDNFLLVPKLDLFHIDHLDDFYLAGESNLVYKLFSFYSHDRDEIFDLVHLDIFYKWALYAGFYPKYSYALRETKFFDLYVEDLWKKLFIPGSREVYESIVWRGHKINADLNECFFLNDWLGNNFSIAKLVKRRSRALRLRSFFARILKYGL